MPAALIEIPPQPRLEIGPPLVEDSRPGRARPLGAALFRAPSFGAAPEPDTGLLGDRRLGTLAGIVGWVLTAAVLTAAVAVLLLRQPQIEALWPPSERLYALLGLH